MKWIDRCLCSLISSSCTVDIIVIDNLSTDGTIQHIQTNYPEVELHCMKQNLGFGTGNNVGLKMAIERKANYVFLLNQDAWVETDTIKNLVTAQQHKPQYGILSPVHLNGTGSDFDDHFYQYLLRAEDQQQLQNFLEKKNTVNPILTVPFVNAAAWCISAACINKTGGFDPLFFHYGEDDNYISRAKHKNFLIGVLLNERIYHDRSSTSAGKRIDLKKQVHSQLTQFLVYASDTSRGNFKWFMFKRAVRHFLLFLKHGLLINKYEMKFNLEMAVKIFSLVGAVNRSRAIYKNEAEMAFL